MVWLFCGDSLVIPARRQHQGASGLMAHLERHSPEADLWCGSFEMTVS